MDRRCALVLALLATACADESDDSPPDDFPPPAMADTIGSARDLEAELPLLMTSTLRRVDAADSTSAGTVRILQAPEPEGALTLTIELNAVRPGVHAWEVRDGDCVASTDSAPTSPGARTLGLIGQVEVGDAGFGEASAMLTGGTVTADDVGRSLYSLVVHDAGPGGGAASPIACADL